MIKLQTTLVELAQWARRAAISHRHAQPLEVGTDDQCRLVADAQAAHQFNDLVNNPHTADFLQAVKLEAAHQRDRFGEAHDRGKSAENWFWLVGYLAGKALRAVVTGDKDKALHHTISSAAALANWYEAIKKDATGAGLGHDGDIRPVEIARFEGTNSSLETSKSDAIEPPRPVTAAALRSVIDLPVRALVPDQYSGR